MHLLKILQNVIVVYLKTNLSDSVSKCIWFCLRYDNKNYFDETDLSGLKMPNEIICYVIGMVAVEGKDNLFDVWVWGIFDYKLKPSLNSMSKINVSGTLITIINKGEEDFICLTEMVANIEDGTKLIERWLNSKTTVDFLGVWEQLNNTNFKTPEFRGIRENVGSGSYFLSVKKWVEQTNAIGVYAKAGRHGSGTWAQIDIAFEFCSYISPEFKLLLITEFKNLKKREAQGLDQIWDFRRFLSKANWRIQTDAIQEVLIPLRNLPKTKEGIIYAEEAEVLNKVVFDKTAKDWNKENPELVKKGHNIRDYGNTHQLIVIANLESLNSELIRNKIAQYERIQMLRQAAIEFLKSLSKSKSIPDTFIDSPLVDKHKHIDIRNIDTDKQTPDIN